MKAVTVARLGGPEELEVATVPTPRPSRSEVSVDVEYASVGLVDSLLREGALRAADGSPLLSPPFIPGLEVAGRVREVGSDVTDLEPGDLVTTLSRVVFGGYAEVALADRSVVVKLQGSDDLATAVALVPNTAAALVALGDSTSSIPDGWSIAVHGAAGGFAGVFPSVARELGAGQVDGTVSSETRAHQAAELGYDRVLTYQNFLGDAVAYNVIVDPVGGPLRAPSLAHLKMGGSLLIVGHASSELDEPVDLDSVWLNNLSIVGFNVGGLLAEKAVDATDAGGRAMALVRSGKVSVPVHVLAMSEATRAHQLMASRTQIGRIALRNDLGSA